MLYVMVRQPGAIAEYCAVNTVADIIHQHHILKEDEEELEEIADHPMQAGKKATAKARARAATEGTVTRIVAKGSVSSKPKRDKGGN